MSHYPEQLSEIEESDFDQRPLTDLIPKLRCTQVAEIALFFEENIEMVQNLILIPYMVAASSPWDSLKASIQTAIQVKAISEGGKPMPPIDIDAEASRILQAVAKENAIQEQYKEVAYTNMIKALNDNQFGREKHVVYRLFSAATVSAWTAFECLAGDLWALAIDLYPHAFAQRASKQIDIAELSRNKFDVSKVLGTILQGKFDFTGVEGITDAYKAIFEHYDSKTLNDPRLRVLEKKRHLLVHRLGRVDDKFIKATGLALSPGSLVPCELPYLAADLNAVIECGCKLLSFVDACIQAQQTR